MRRASQGSAGPFGPALLAPVLLVTILNPINATMIATALSSIGRSFDVGARETAWVVAALYLSAAIGQPAAGRLADLIGPRRVLLGGLAVAATAGLLGALAPSLAVLVVARALLGFGTATGFPTALLIVRTRTAGLPVAEADRILGRIALTGQTALAVGPVLGGLLVGAFGWRAVLAVNVPFALLGIVLAWRGLPHDPPRAVAPGGLRRALDVPGVLLFAAAISAVLMFATTVGQGDAAVAGALAATVLVLTVSLVAWELRRDDPFLDVRMLVAHRALSLTIARYGATFVVLYGILFGFAQWLEDARGLTPEQSGLIMLPMLVIGAIGTVVGARARSVRTPLIIGTVALVAGSAAMLGLSATSSVAMLLAVSAVFGLPQGFGFIANQMALYRQAPAEHLGSASGLYRTSQYVAAIAASSIIGLSFSPIASDEGLQKMAVVLVVLSVALLLVTLATLRLVPAAGPARLGPTVSPGAASASEIAP